ncbi:MAG: alpha/beta hydrolase [Deltaproteobacteria bacterium]|nr:alpha/beta hydrolase [Deltaproteobacteria bacterium]
MTEERMFFQSERLKIEGLINETPGENAVVVTHPHPLYGGEMHNNVVESLIAAYQQKGFTTLRFNFRGVGRSEGSHGQGVGEQEDVRAALAYLTDLGKSSLDLAGYSFGSWVNAMGLESFDPVRRLVMVSPPVAVIDFSFLGYSPRIKLVISGSEDDIAPPAMIKDMLPTWNPEAAFKVIEGVDHFYLGGTNHVEEIIKDSLKQSYE